MTEYFDIAIIGAGFGGLACAKAAARQGLSVLVMDRKKTPGQGMHTTGILVKEAAVALNLPNHLVRSIQEVRLFAPNFTHIHLHSQDYFFQATDTTGLMQHFSKEVQLAGAHIRYGMPYKGAHRENDAILLKDYGIRCRFLIGADGARSDVARDMGLGQNSRFLIGAEVELEGADQEDRSFSCFLTQKLAPGYIGWVVPGVGVTQVGLAVREPFKPDIDAFLHYVRPHVRHANWRIVARRGGLIPVGGRVRPLVRGNVLLLGDAAGIVSPLTGGGIHTALHYGEVLGEAIAAHMRQNAPHPATIVERIYPRFFFKQIERLLFHRFAPDFALNLVLGNPVFKRIAENIFFRVKRLKE